MVEPTKEKSSRSIGLKSFKIGVYTTYSRAFIRNVFRMNLDSDQANRLQNRYLH